MVKRKPKEPAMGTSLGDLLFQKGVKQEEAAEHSDTANGWQREKAAIEERMKMLEEQKNKLEQANEDLTHEVGRLDALIRQLREDEAGQTAALFERAVQELKNGNFLYVLGLLQAVLIREPEHLKAMINLSVVYAELGFREQAVETLKAVLAKDPNDALARKNLALIGEQGNRRV